MANDKQKTAKQFAENWAGRGYEKGDAQVFWTELLHDVVGIEKVSASCRFEYRTSSGGFIDCLIPDAGVLIEQKALGVDLDKPELRQGRMVTPFEQALSYAESFPRNRQPRFIVVCNFGEFRVHDRDACAREELSKHYISFTLEELGDKPYYLNFIVDPANSRAEKEKRVSMEAGRLIGELHTMLREQYIDPDSEESQRALNILCVRLVFCLFCEDAQLFPKDAFLDYLRKVEPENIRYALKKLFQALNTPFDQRDPYDTSLKPFPYVNGGLFAEESEIPNFTQDIKHKLLFEVSQQTDWASISPTIFGGIFESTLNPETRRKGGMHYTSIENIHKVIDPLFLDELQTRFDSIRFAEGATPKNIKKQLREFHKEIAGYKFLDPACGSGNFLTETYLSLRRLEDQILSVLNDGQTEISFGEEPEEVTRIRLSQFYGIEINDFAVRVAQTALWIAQLQANDETDMVLDIEAQDFPLRDSANIVEANALRIDWNDVVPADKCDYVMGNPPFIGHQWRSKTQQDDMGEVFGKLRGAGKLDYVCAWFEKAARYASDRDIKTSFVATNSICQGESVGILWRRLASLGMSIDFAWRPFVWNSEADDEAHVHVVVVGFSRADSEATLYDEGLAPRRMEHINGYLSAAPDVFIENRGKPVNAGAPEMTKGSQPTDGGNLILSGEERAALLAKYPDLDEVIRPYVGGREFLNGGDRWCLWFDGVDLSRYAYPEIAERLRAVAEARSSSPTASVREAAATPHLFTQIRQPKTDFLALPVVSSGRRKYLSVGYMPRKVIASDQLRFIPTDSLFILGLLSSHMHAAWMRVVAGRLKSDYRYSPSIYNSFVFPDASDEQRSTIELCAQAVLDARAQYEGKTLAELYDPDKAVFFPELMKAHKALDAAVEAAYGVDFNGDEEKIVAHLFKLYAELTSEQPSKSSPSKTSKDIDAKHRLKVADDFMNEYEETFKKLAE